METPGEEMGSYRDLEAYRMARSLMVDVCRDDLGIAAETRERLAHVVVSLAIHIVDGWNAGDPTVRELHLRAAVECADEAASLIDVCRADGTVSEREARALLDLQRRTRMALAAEDFTEH